MYFSDLEFVATVFAEVKSQLGASGAKSRRLL